MGIREPEDQAVAADVVVASRWSRRSIAMTGEVVADTPTDDRVTGEPWWEAVRATLAEAPKEDCPEVQMVTTGSTVMIVERGRSARPVVYLFPAMTPHTPNTIERLTKRQREVAALLVLGHSTRQIAEELYIGVTTARSHIEDTYRRLGAHNRAQAVARLLGDRE
jgi:DNA-binding NarL/FixJ family response regulator